MTNQLAEGHKTNHYDERINNSERPKRLTKVTSLVIQNKDKLLNDKERTERVFTDMMTKHNELYRKWRIADLITAILTISGLIIAIAEYEVGFIVFKGARSNISVERNVLRVLVTLTSIASVITIIVRYYFKRKWQNLPIPKEVHHQVYNNDYTNLMRQNRRKRFISFKLIFDVLLCLV